MQLVAFRATVDMRRFLLAALGIVAGGHGVTLPKPNAKRERVPLLGCEHQYQIAHQELTQHWTDVSRHAHLGWWGNTTNAAPVPAAQRRTSGDTANNDDP